MKRQHVLIGNIRLKHAELVSITVNGTRFKERNRFTGAYREAALFISINRLSAKGTDEVMKPAADGLSLFIVCILGLKPSPSRRNL